MIFNTNTLLISIFLALSMACAEGAGVRFTCFGSGTVGTECAPFVNDFCNSLITNIAFRNNQERCYNTPDIKCDFAAFYEFPNVAGNPPAAAPSIANCLNTLDNATAICGGLGGFGNVGGGGFTFTLDPNQGQCGQIEACGS
ncbi:hypothetical protein BDQ12DRAFT_692925 [Crucibulum laeve]|uniref:Glycan binding protein Y3-like domain-containing protein n=1 Tax=Crucibulum laeve TaxID=68775 RepID=A0A5C3LHH5_9AGAR|nr:hypothetical protein BDQ12DRAFT_692925 [Crucibulum laeve]